VSSIPIPTGFPWDSHGVPIPTGNPISTDRDKCLQHSKEISFHFWQMDRQTDRFNMSTAMWTDSQTERQTAISCLQHSTFNTTGYNSNRKVEIIIPSPSAVLVRFTWATNVSTPRSIVHHGLVSLCERAQLLAMPSFAKRAPYVPGWSLYVLTWYGGLFSATLWRTASVTVQNSTGLPDNLEKNFFAQISHLRRYTHS